MCGRFTLTASFKDILDRFDIQQYIEEELYTPSYNTAPSQMVLSVINDGSKNRLGFLRWGLIPPWAKDEKIGYKMINARGETLAEKQSFRNAYQKKRCLIIADSFYEWKRLDDRTKIPMRIRLKTDELFGMAGLWESWNSLTGEKIYSCTIITTAANNLMASIHDRMPVILKREDEQTWLNPALTDYSELNQLLKPFDDRLMDAYEVSSLVNSPKNNGVQLIQKIC